MTVKIRTRFLLHVLKGYNSFAFSFLVFTLFLCVFLMSRQLEEYHPIVNIGHYNRKCCRVSLLFISTFFRRRVSYRALLEVFITFQRNGRTDIYPSLNESKLWVTSAYTNSQLTDRHNNKYIFLRSVSQFCFDTTFVPTSHLYLYFRTT